MIFGMIAPMYVVSGFIVGVLVGMTGVGGGSLMTPLLVLAFGFHPSTAVGTDLLFSSATKTVGTLVHGAERTVNWKIAALLGCGSIPAALVTLVILARIGAENKTLSTVIDVTVGVALLFTAVTLLFKERIVAYSQRGGKMSARNRRVATVSVGVLLGVLVSLSSVAAGAIGVTALFFLYPRLEAAEIVGTDIAHAVPLTLTAGIGHLLIGAIKLSVLGSLLMGSIPGIIIGSLCATRVPERILRRVLATVLVIVGGQLLLT